MELAKSRMAATRRDERTGPALASSAKTIWDGLVRCLHTKRCDRGTGAIYSRSLLHPLRMAVWATVQRRAAYG